MNLHNMRLRLARITPEGRQAQAHTVTEAEQNAAYDAYMTARYGHLHTANDEPLPTFRSENLWTPVSKGWRK